MAKAYDKWPDPWLGLSRLLADADVPSAVIEGLKPTRRNAYSTVSMLLPAISQAQVGLVMELLYAEVGRAKGEVPRTLTWSMLADMQRSGFTIGSHTRTHAWLANESPEKRFDEIELRDALLHGRGARRG